MTAVQMKSLPLQQ